MAQVEQQFVARDHARDFLFVEDSAATVPAMLVMRMRGRTEHDFPARSGADAPVGVFPVEQVVVARIGDVAAQHVSTAERTAAARIQVATRELQVARIALVDFGACGILVEVGPAGFLGGAASDR